MTANSGYLHHYFIEGPRIDAQSCDCAPPTYVVRSLAHCLLADFLVDGMERVVCRAAAKVPIVKIWDPELQLACDMNVNNTLALENTRMIKTYVQLDERVRPLAIIIKHWTKQRILNDAGKYLDDARDDIADM